MKNSSSKLPVLKFTKPRISYLLSSRIRFSGYFIKILFPKKMAPLLNKSNTMIQKFWWKSWECRKYSMRSDSQKYSLPSEIKSITLKQSSMSSPNYKISYSWNNKKIESSQKKSKDYKSAPSKTRSWKHNSQKKMKRKHYKNFAWSKSMTRWKAK